MMKKLDLGSGKMEAWRSMLPDDVKVLIQDDAPALPDAALEVLCQDLDLAGGKRIPDVLGTHGDLVVHCGRARRIRILAWVVNRTWPDSADVIRQITRGDEGDEGETSAGRSKIAPFFRSDMEALGLVSMSRVVRSAADTRNIDAVATGIKDFELSVDMQHGGMI